MRSRKTAGTSIQVALSQFCKGKRDIITTGQLHIGGKLQPKSACPVNKAHQDAMTVKKYLGKKWGTMFTFGFVRNPWDLMVSRYCWDKQGMDCSKSDFEEWLFTYIEGNVKKRAYIDENLLSPYFCIDGELVVDYVGRYENLKSDFDHVCKTIGLPITELPKKTRYDENGRPFRNHLIPYTAWYRNRTIELIARTFRKDIVQFGYEFGDSL